MPKQKHLNPQAATLCKPQLLRIQFILLFAAFMGLPGCGPTGRFTAEPLVVVESPEERAQRQEIEAEELGNEDSSGQTAEDRPEADLSHIPSPEEEEVRSLSRNLDWSLAQKIDQDFSRYTNDIRTLRLVTAVMRNHQRNPGRYRKPRMTYCFRAVKDALLQSGYTRTYLRGRSAALSGTQYRSIGFVNLLDFPEYRTILRNPNLAPKGALLVYSGGRYGHTEIKTSRPTEAPRFDSFSATRRAAYGMHANGTRRLIGVYIHGDYSP